MYLNFTGIYIFIVDYSIEVSVDIVYGFNICINKGTEPGSLATTNFYEGLIEVRTATENIL